VRIFRASDGSIVTANTTLATMWRVRFVFVCQIASNCGSDAILMMFRDVYDAPISLA
jgi:hypothetical protein